MKQFLATYFEGADYSIEAMRGDAGQRKYYRALHQDQSYVVMDCQDSSVQPFIDMAIYLTDQGFSAPQILHQDVVNGFLLLEDFGTVSVTNYLLSDVKDENARKEIYYLAIDLLVSLQDKKVPENLIEFDNDLLLSELKLFTDYYIPYAYKRELSAEEIDEFKEIWKNILLKQAPMLSSVILRDYHVDNMMYLKNNESIQKLGLLDFQDALSGSPIYDVVSILEDARIKVSRLEALGCVEYFAKKKKMDIEAVLLNYHILGAQRNSRILGVFVRKAIRDGDEGYLKFMPRVLEYLKYDLSHDALSSLNEWLDKKFA